MIDAYSVGVTLKLHDLISSELVRVSRALYRIDELATQLNRKFESLGKQANHFRSLAQSASSLSKNMDKATAETFRLDRAMESLRANGGLPLVGAGAERNLAVANVEAKSLLTTLREIRVAGSLPNLGGAGGGRGGGRIGHGGVLHGGALHLGTNGVGVGSVGLGGGEAGPIIGGAVIAAGMTAYGAKAMAEAAGAFEYQKARFRLFGMSKEQNDAAFAFAESQRIPGATKTDMMKYMVEAQGAFRESGKSGDEALQGAKIAAPLLAKIHYASLLSGTELTEKQELDMLRYAEQRGGTTNPARFAQLVEDALKTTITSGGQVNFSELRQFMRTSQLAGMSVSDDALLGWYEPLMGELKGGPLGTAMATASKRLMGITKATKTQMSSIRDIGLWDMSKVVLNKQGGVDHFLGDGIPLKHADEWGKNQVKYYLDYVMPLYMKRGYDQSQISKHNADLFGNTGGAMMDKAGQQMPMIQEGLHARAVIPGLKQIMDETKGTLTGAEHDFMAAWGDFKTEFGKDVLPGFTRMLKTATEVLRWMASVQASPDKPKFNGPYAYGLQWAGKAAGALYDKFVGGASKDSSGRRWFEFGPKISAYQGQPQSHVPPTATAAASTPVTINLDGRKVGEAVIPHIAKSMNRQPTGPRAVDPTSGLFPVSASLGY